MKNIVAIIFMAFVAVTMAAPKPEADPAYVYSHLTSNVHAFPYSYGSYPYSYGSYPYYYGGHQSHSAYPIYYGYGYHYPTIQAYSGYHNVEGVPVVV